MVCRYAVTMGQSWIKAPALSLLMFFRLFLLKLVAHLNSNPFISRRRSPGNLSSVPQFYSVRTAGRQQASSKPNCHHPSIPDPPPALDPLSARDAFREEFLYEAAIFSRGGSVDPTNWDTGKTAEDHEGSFGRTT